ncbi:hypothetical protein M7I_6343 [Glarea lozoyensis 74030]|uniref:Uncharacterized protein n=1 Tax=Glarea lozoyensis (strain ATCC 74030 / MF5533) TaxID=1104152 RepID=H0EUB0_GLAL7|nr:hypothetical protein M7I_6343 [Glarea lozoyensis 74030]
MAGGIEIYGFEVSGLVAGGCGVVLSHPRGGRLNAGEYAWFEIHSRVNR